MEDLERILTRVRNKADRDRRTHVSYSTVALSSVAAAVGGAGDTDTERVKAEFEEKLQAAEKERGSAKALVSKIKKLVVKN